MLTKEERSYVLTDILKLAIVHETASLADNKKVISVSHPNYFITLTNPENPSQAPIIEFSKEAQDYEYLDQLLAKETNIILYQGGPHGLFSIGYQLVGFHETHGLITREKPFKGGMSQSYNRISPEDTEQFDRYLIHIRETL